MVEDDVRLRSIVRLALQGHGFQIDTAPDGGTALARLKDGGIYAVVVLDIGLPDSDGRDVCQAMRSEGVRSPVLFLTARGQVGDQLSAFAAGGDDFLAKPFHVEVLAARVTALSRRAVPPDEVTAGTALGLDPRSHALVVGDERVPLTPTEYRILGCLLSSVGVVVRRRELIGAAWPTGAVVTDNTLDQYLTRLRRKLAVAASRPGAPGWMGTAGARVVTVHGVGYRLERAAAT